MFKMRGGFETIVRGWFRDDMVQLGRRVFTARHWLRVESSVRRDFDEQFTLELMTTRHMFMAAQAAVFEPLIRAKLTNEAISRALYDEE